MAKNELHSDSGNNMPRKKIFHKILGVVFIVLACLMCATIISLSVVQQKLAADIAGNIEESFDEIFVNIGEIFVRFEEDARENIRVVSGLVSLEHVWDVFLSGQKDFHQETRRTVSAALNDVSISDATEAHRVAAEVDAQLARLAEENDSDAHGTIGALVRDAISTIGDANIVVVGSQEQAQRDINDIKRRAMHAIEDSMARGWLGSLVPFFLIMIIALIVIIVMSFFMTRSITQPIRTMMASLRAISRGDLSVRTKVNSTDEIGELSAAFDRMMDSLLQVTASRDDLNKEIAVRKEAEAAVRKERDFAESLIQTAQAIVLVLDVECNIVRFNAYLEQLTGYTLDEVQGKNWIDVFVPEAERDAIRSLFMRTVSDEKGKGEVNAIVTKSGEEIQIEWANQVLKDDDGTVRGMLAIGQDITDRLRIEEHRRQLEKDLQLARKLESIGTLAAGVAHEINTPVQYVTDNVTFCSKAFELLRELIMKYREAGCTVENVPDDFVGKADYILKELPHSIDDAIEGLDRVTKIVNAMKNFSHLNQDTIVTADLNEAIESTIIVAQNEWKHAAIVERDFDETLPSVECYLADVNQVVMNILINATHAIKDVVGEEPLERGVITVKTYREDDSVVIRISDTGSGIPEDIRAQIYDPFFTTKEVGKGTGQGLSIAYQTIVTKHHGALWFETEEGRGTTFFIRLPIEHTGMDATS